MWSASIGCLMSYRLKVDHQDDNPSHADDPDYPDDPDDPDVADDGTWEL